MKKIIIILFVFLLFVNSSFASNYTYSGKIEVAESINSNDLYFSTPVAISKNSKGEYFVADLGNSRIVKLDRYMNKIGEIPNIDMPIFVYVDRDDNILVCEMSEHKILKYDPNFNLIKSWGSKGSANSQFEIPRSIVQDSLKNYYVSDELNHRIQKFDKDGNFLKAYGVYGSKDGEFKVQQGLSIDSKDRLYVSDTYNNRIQIFSTNPWRHLKTKGKYGVYYPFNYWSFQSNIFHHPRGVYVNPDTDKMIVTDSSNNRVMAYNSFDRNLRFDQSQNGFLTMVLPTHAIMDSKGYIIAIDSHSRIMKYSYTFNNTNAFNDHGKYRRLKGMFSNPQSVCVDKSSNDVYVTDSFNHRIQKFDENGKWLKSYGGIGGPYGIGTLLGYFIFPKQVTTDQSGNLYVADMGNSRIVKIEKSSSRFRRVVSSYNLGMPWGVQVDSKGYIYVSDWKDDKVKIFKNGRLIRTFGGTGKAEGKFIKPSEIKLKEYGNNVDIYVMDTGNNRLQVFDKNGNFKFKLGEPLTDPLKYYQKSKDDKTFLLPYSLAFDKNSNLIVADTSHKTVRIFDSNNKFISNLGYMSSSKGNFFSPMSVDVNLKTGRLYVVDGVLQRVQFFDKENP